MYLHVQSVFRFLLLFLDSISFGTGTSNMQFPSFHLYIQFLIDLNVVYTPKLDFYWTAVGSKWASQNPGMDIFLYRQTCFDKYLINYISLPFFSKLFSGALKLCTSDYSVERSNYARLMYNFDNNSLDLDKFLRLLYYSKEADF